MPKWVITLLALGALTDASHVRKNWGVRTCGLQYGLISDSPIPLSGDNFGIFHPWWHYLGVVTENLYNNRCTDSRRLVPSRGPFTNHNHGKKKQRCLPNYTGLKRVATTFVMIHEQIISTAPKSVPNSSSIQISKIMPYVDRFCKKTYGWWLYIIILYIQLALREHDAKQLYMARQHLLDIKNIYSVLTDVIHKNIQKVSAISIRCILFTMRLTSIRTDEDTRPPRKQSSRAILKQFNFVTLPQSNSPTPLYSCVASLVEQSII